MPESPISTGLQILFEFIKILNPSDLERIKKEIRKREEEIVKIQREITAAIDGGDIDAINMLLLGELPK